MEVSTLKFKSPLLVFLLGFTLFATNSHAAPAISKVAGTLSAGSGITISGSGFGTGPKVILFDDFSSGTNGSTVRSTAKVGKWAQAGTITYADTKLSGSYGARCIGESGWLKNIVEFGTSYSEVFVSSMAYVPNGYKFPAADAVETFPEISALKHQWLTYSADGYSSKSDPDIASPSWTGRAFYSVGSNDSPISTFDQNGDVKWVWGAPVRWSLWIKGNGTSATGSDGFFQAVSSAGQKFKSYKDYKAWFNPDHTVRGFDRMYIPGFFRSGVSFSNRENYVIDDVYVAVGPNAQARVEIGNAASYSSCTKLALSTPTNWSDGSISATFRSGGFATGAQAYLYVVDKNGNVNSKGYAINVGTTASSGTTAAPAKPGSAWISAN
jgi:hypothetical protein